MTRTSDEQVPLLQDTTIEQTQFPWLQFSIIFALKTSEFLTSTTTHPFIPDLVRHVGITNGERNVGYYVALLLSTFFAAETVTTFLFSHLSDLVGRKPVLLTCVIGLSICICGFGVSMTFWILVLWQAIMGALNGTMGVAKSMLVEAADSTHLARAIGYFGTSAYVANMIGGKIGGSLARPVEQYPHLFGSSEFLKKYPYFLPCAVSSILLFISWLSGVAFLKETVAKPLPISSILKRNAREETSEEGTESVRKPPLRAIFVRPVIIAATNLAALALVDRFYIAADALYLSTPIKDGGLGFSVNAIGTFSSTSGTVVCVSQLFFFAPIHANLGSKYLFIIGLSAALPRFALWPAMNWIARNDGYMGWVWFGLGFQMCCSAFIQFAYGAIWVLIARSPGNRSSLGAVVGFCHVGNNVVRTIGSAVSNSLFSLSIDKGYLGGYFAYFIFICVTIIALCATLLLPRDEITQERKR
ncbi:member of major facilitator superfamily multidrug-resistance, DHA1 sub-family [Amanita rubescens]|nr:member of major facilitator superfamily multidrug-resistance, DHA1 sub-family [Amanita rubescens]